MSNKTLRAFGTSYMIEIPNHGESEGALCMEGVEVKVCDDGGGPYLAIKGRNLEPTEEFDSHTLTLGRDHIDQLAAHLHAILDQAEPAKRPLADKALSALAAAAAADIHYRD